MVDIKVFTQNEKLKDAYEELLESINKISEDFQLSYFELYGILDAVKCDLYACASEEN